MNRREWCKNTIASAAALTVAGADKLLAEIAETEPVSGAAAASGATASPPANAAEIYKLLGYATMTGESPLTMWARLKETKEWLAGPLAPDSWAGQVFIADHADIFGFRFMSVPAVWMGEKRPCEKAGHAVEQFAKWYENWPTWWKFVGPRAPDDSYARLVWQMPENGAEVSYEWARTGSSEIVCRITQSNPSDLVLQAYVPWANQPPNFAVIYSESPDRKFLHGRSWVPGTRDGMRWVLAMSSPVDDSRGIGTNTYHGVFPDAKTLYLCGKQGQTYEALEIATQAWLEPGKIDTLLEANREKYLEQRPKGSGWLVDVPGAINDQLQWSEVYTPQRKRAYITVSRAWAREGNSAPDFLWDSFFSALLVSQEDERKAFAMVRDITSWQNEQGMFCQYGQWMATPNKWIFPAAWGHTQYPVGALATAKIYLRRPNREFLEEIYPRLLKNHKWWFADRGDGQSWRDGNGNGLLELGSNYPWEIPYEDRQQTAYFESHDDSPQWWHVASYNEKTNTIELDTVERNCMYSMDAHVLAWMARELGKTEDAAALDREHAVMTKRINDQLWNSSLNTYANRWWQKKEDSWFNSHMAPDIFLSLLGKVAPQERAEHIRKIFHDPKKFAGEWILPTISRDDPKFPQQHYWRGKIWAPINWLVYQGFKIYDWDHEARLLAESSAKMFLKPWRTKGECYENFLATTGEGSSDPHYTWGAMMVLVAIEEVIDINPWHGLRFGNLEPVEEAGIERYYVAGSLYDVSLSPKHLEVRKDGRLLLSANAPVEVRNVRYEGQRVKFEVRSLRTVKLRVGSGPARDYLAGVTKGEGSF